MYKLFIYFILFLTVLCSASLVKAEEPIKIAVLDTSVRKNIWNNPKRFHLCDEGHKDFTGVGFTEERTFSHASNVISAINNSAGNSNYCIILLNVFDYFHNKEYYTEALAYLLTINVDIINISGGGDRFNLTEYLYIKQHLEHGVKIIAAAGNNNRNIDEIQYYPASLDPKIIVVNNNLFVGSNFGKTVDYSISFNSSGMTSLATAKFTGLLTKRVDKLWKSRAH